MIADGVVREEPYRDLLSRAAAVRGLPPPDSLPARVLTSSEVLALVRRVIEEDYEEGELEGYQEGLVTVGLWPPDRDLAAVYADVSSEEFIGLYVPKERTLYVVSDARIPFSVKVASMMSGRDYIFEMVLAHEIVHALQHEAYPELMDEDWPWKESDDASLAVSAAIEGDALFYGFETIAPGAELSPGFVRDTFGRDAEGNPRGALANAPALIRLTLAFPYVEGYGLSFDERRDLLDEPPVSTEQVLHPERRRQAFAAIDLGPLRASLPGGCTVLDENSVGELGFAILFQDLGADVDPSVWDGWDGDRYLAARCGDRREFVWLAAWDSEHDADEFVAAYEAIADSVRARAGHDGVPRAARHGREVRIASPGLASFSELLGSLPRRTRVATLSELRAHFAASGREL